jgi:hypothetical protein
MIKFYYHGDYSYMISHIIPLLSSFLVIFGGWNLHFFSAKFRSDLRHSEPNAQTTGPGGPWDIGIGLVSDIVEWSFWIGKPKRWNRSNSDQHMVASPWNRFGYPEISWGWRFAKMVVPQTMGFFHSPISCFTMFHLHMGEERVPRAQASTWHAATFRGNRPAGSLVFAGRFQDGVGPNSRCMYMLNSVSITNTISYGLIDVLFTCIHFYFGAIYVFTFMSTYNTRI